MKRTFNNVIQDSNAVDKKILKQLLGDEDYKDFKYELKTLTPLGTDQRTRLSRKSIVINNIEINPDQDS